MVEKSTPPTRKRRTVSRKNPSGKKLASGTPTEVKQKIDGASDKLVEGVKESLEYELVNKDVRVTIHGKRLTFTAWGLVKEMQFGGRIVSLLNRIKGIITPEDLNSGDIDLTLVSHLFSLVAEDVIDVIAGSITDPFQTHAKAFAWIDQECDFKDLFDMGVIVYDQNLKGEHGLGKRIEGLTTVVQDVTKLLGNALPKQ